MKNHYKNIVARFYDSFLKDRKDDINFYRDYVKQKKKSPKVLELACGTGRILLPLLKEGIQVEGSDFSEEMIGILKEKLAGVNLNTGLSVQDMSRFESDRRYDLILVTCASFMILPEKRALPALKCIWDHLAEDGELLMDLFIPWHNIQDPNPDSFRITRDVTEENERCLAYEKCEIDLENQLKKGTYKYEYFKNGILQEVQLDELFARWYWESEIILLLKEAGFFEVEILKDNALYSKGHSYVVRGLK